MALMIQEQSESTSHIFVELEGLSLTYLKQAIILLEDGQALVGWINEPPQSRCPPSKMRMIRRGRMYCPPVTPINRRHGRELEQI